MLNVFVAPNHASGRLGVLKQLKNNLQDGAHSLIVPDRFALFHEKAVFEALDVTSLFNVEVLSFSRLSKKILGANESVSKIAGTMIVKNLLDENRKNFRCFNKSLSSSGFAGEVYGTIQQLKSCDILPKNLLDATKGEDYLSKKMYDLALIYEKYDDYLLKNNLLDSGGEFNKLLDEMEGSDYFADRHIYICAFDSFTAVAYKIIEKLIKICKSVNIVVYMDEKNKNIYPADTYQNILAFAKKAGSANMFEVSNVLSGQFGHLGENLFRFKVVPQKIKDSKIALSEHRDILEEVVNAAQIIRAGVIREGLRYKDFAVAISNLEQNQKIVQKVFEEFDISYFLDTSTPLSDTVIVQFVNKCIDSIRFGFLSSDLIALCKNSLSGISFEDACSFEDILTKYDLERECFKKQIKTPEKEYQVFDRVRNVILNALAPLGAKGTAKAAGKKAPDNAAEFVAAVKQVVANFGAEEHLKRLTNKYREQGLLKECQQSGQMFDKLNEVLDSLTKVLGNAKIDAHEFLDILSSGLGACSVSSVPISLDSVFVGDVSNSFFESVDTLFVLGASAGDMPKTLQDSGIILDGEIEILKRKYNIEPSIKTINAREKFKVYNLVLSPQNRLFVSYHTKGTSAKQPYSPFVGQIRDMFLLPFGTEYKPLEITKNSSLNFAEQMANVSLAGSKLSGVLRHIYDGGNVINQKQYATLLSFLADKNTYFKNYKYLLEFKNSPKLSTSVLGENSKISASGVETFYTCPFMYFAKYGLGLDEKLPVRFDALTIGNILHKFAEKLHKAIKLPADDKSVKDVSEQVIESVLGEYSILTQLPQNKIAVINIKKEAVRLGEALNFQAKNSDFKIAFTEVKFGEGAQLEGLKINIGKKTLVVSGQIDRVDILDDFFRVIDYKTGAASTSLSELYFGKKIQLYLYQAVFNKRYKPAGAYYLPIKDKLAEKGKSQQWLYRLKGYTLFDPKIVLGSDKGLKEGVSSDIVEVRRNADKDGQPSFHEGHSKLLTHEQMIAFAEYALKLTEGAAKNILQGNIAPSPLVLASRAPCEYCKFGCICRFDAEFANLAREPKQKIDEAFVCDSLKPFKKGTGLQGGGCDG